MKILLIEPFYGGSHRVWADNLKQIFGENLDLLSLPDKYWKWRMEASAWKLAEQYKRLDQEYDIILFSDLINLPLFISLSKLDRKDLRLVMYMHENQITYPWNENDEDVEKGRDRHYGFINLMNAIVADELIFNSSYHKKSFIGALESFVKPFPDAKVQIDIPDIKSKSSVLPVPLNLKNLINNPKHNVKEIPTILWNHRWEHDKNPELFFKTLNSIKQKDIAFKLIILGEKYNRYPVIFDEAANWFKNEIIHLGYCESISEYHNFLKESDLLPVCSHHDFFGISVVEAIAAGCIPLLPNHLAYPEHLSPTVYPELFYDTEDLFESKLIQLINDRPQVDLQDEMKKYDLSEVRQAYMAKLK